MATANFGLRKPMGKLGEVKTFWLYPIIRSIYLQLATHSAYHPVHSSEEVDAELDRDRRSRPLTTFGYASSSQLFAAV